MSKPTDGYILYDASGKEIGYGTGCPELRDGETIRPSNNPTNEPEAIAIEAAISAQSDILNVEEWKTPEEYAGKSENAERWINNNPMVIGDAPLIPESSATSAEIMQHTHGDYTAERYRWMSIEIDEKGCSPRECAELIMWAITRNDVDDIGSWEKAKRRVALRELLRSS